jgi:hypothetical protein
MEHYSYKTRKWNVRTLNQGCKLKNLKKRDAEEYSVGRVERRISNKK